MLDLDPIQQRADAAFRGPWRWRGNTDTGDVRLVGRAPAWNDPQRTMSCDILGTIGQERTADDPGAKAYAEYLRDTQVDDGVDPATGRRKWRSYTDAEIAEKVREDYVEDAWGEVRKDQLIAFVDPATHCYREARGLAVYEVAVAQGLPDDTPRDHPKVYRADIVGIRNPNAVFIEHARSDVDALLDEVTRLRGIVEQAHRLCGLIERSSNDVRIEQAADNLAASIRELS